MPVVSISMPASLLDRLDEFIEEHEYSGRSEAVREGARGLLAEVEEPVGGGDEVCVVTAGFDHDARAEAALSKLRHRHDDLVTANLHSHAGDACLELFVVEGPSDEIGSFVARLWTVDGVTTVEQSTIHDDRPRKE